MHRRRHAAGVAAAVDGIALAEIAAVRWGIEPDFQTAKGRPVWMSMRCAAGRSGILIRRCSAGRSLAVLLPKARQSYMNMLLCFYKGTVRS